MYHVSIIVPMIYSYAVALIWFLFHVAVAMLLLLLLWFCCCCGCCYASFHTIIIWLFDFIILAVSSISLLVLPSRFWCVGCILYYPLPAQAIGAAQRPLKLHANTNNVWFNTRKTRNNTWYLFYLTCTWQQTTVLFCMF